MGKLRVLVTREKSTGPEGSPRHDVRETLNQDQGGPATNVKFSLLRSRRRFLGSVGGVAAAAWTAGAIGLQPLLGSEVSAAEIGPLLGDERADQALEIREAAAQVERAVSIPAHPDNGDEALYLTKIGNYSKALPHNGVGEVDLNAYNSLIAALSSGRPSDFEAIPLAGQRKLVNPQAGLAFDLEGTDGHQLELPAAPALASAEAAGELVELYWMALLRDGPFTAYHTDPLAKAAAAELSKLTDFRGPKVGNKVTSRTLFRGFTPGDLTGPYLSQFLLKTATFGSEEVQQRIRTVLPLSSGGADYLTDVNSWLLVQDGGDTGLSDRFDTTRRFVRTGRDLGQYVHVDVLFQAYFNACLILLEMGVPFNPGNPYNASNTQVGFGTFGLPHVTTLVAEVATRALKAAWYQKWDVHRRLRPEEFGGRVHFTKTGLRSYPLHPNVLNSDAVARVFNLNGTCLLPQAYPESCPTHPSYGAGHATVAGACVTILKAFFDESFVVPDPVVPSDDGLSLNPFTGPDRGKLTVGGELNKLAANIATGRNFAGIHYRTDYSESVKLGEAIAISILRDQRSTYNESFSGFTFTKFDGTKITV